MVQQLTKRIIITSSEIDSRRDVDRIEARLSGLEGVREVNVSSETHTVDVSFDPTVISAVAIQAEVEKLGYKIDSVSEQAPLPL